MSGWGKRCQGKRGEKRCQVEKRCQGETVGETVEKRCQLEKQRETVSEKRWEKRCQRNGVRYRF